MVLTYLFSHFIAHLLLFLRHWYYNGFLNIFGQLINSWSRLDRTFALKVTFRNWTKPLYQDYSMIGYILGFIARTGRILLASLIYFGVALVFIAAYLFWALIPAWLILRIFIKAPLGINL